MIPTITPVGYGRHTRLKWLTAVGLYAISAAIASLMTCALAAALGLLTSSVAPSFFELRWLWLSLLALGYCLHESQVIRMPTPQRRQQVPKIWRDKYHPWITASAYGFVIGSGLITRISVSTFYLLLAWSFLSANPLQAAGVGLLYGLSQGALVLVTAWNVKSPDDATRIGTAVWSWMFNIHKINAIFLGLVTIYSGWTFMRIS
jgi:hypothetical protein